MIDFPRYLVAFNTDQLPAETTDVLVVGSGVAGIRAALAAAAHANVTLVTKATLPDSTTSHAQGGIAIAPAGPEATTSHVRDTLDVACGLAHPEAVEFMASQAQASFLDLCNWGMNFDRRNGELDYAREGGHSHARILHADGDATGRELARTLIAQLRRTPSIDVEENCFVVDLLTGDGRCIGAILADERGDRRVLWARQTILATGGCGRIFRESTNPAESTGDGVALAFRTGAELQDMEMMQFHPTVLYVNGACKSLISEAVRGAGAKLRDAQGNRFMPAYHERGELAPRDAVSRAILAQLEKTNTACVYLDIRDIGIDAFRRRFPHISQSCDELGIDVAGGLLPVRPAAHYMVGGIRVDLDGRSTLHGLFACGEVASSGIHGANRLASNSLLEGLVFGARAGAVAGKLAKCGMADRGAPIRSGGFRRAADRTVDWRELRAWIQEAMWSRAGITRNGTTLHRLIEEIEGNLRDLASGTADSREAFEGWNLMTTAWLLAVSAARRAESRGVHFRSDFPTADDANWRCHIVMRRTDAGVEVRQMGVAAVGVG